MLIYGVRRTSVLTSCTPIYRYSLRYSTSSLPACKGIGSSSFDDLRSVKGMKTLVGRSILF